MPSLRRGCLWGAGGLIALIGLGPSVTRELAIHGSNARISPDGKAVVERIDSSSLRIDRLPTGNVLGPSPNRFAAATILDFGWEGNDVIWIRVKGKVRPSDLEEIPRWLQVRVRNDEESTSESVRGGV